MIYLSHFINKNTPTYGNRNIFHIEKKSDMKKGDIANDSYIKTTVHIGTHIDLPYHFYDNAQTLKDYDACFLFFSKPLIVCLENIKDFVIKDELIEKLENIHDRDYDILLVKTGICHRRHKRLFWEKNYGFSPDIYDYLIEKFPAIRVFGFDSISISSLTNRNIGRQSHKQFLNPLKPILLLEDMNLCEVNELTKLSELIIAPMMIEDCDALPCTVIGKIK